MLWPLLTAVSLAALVAVHVWWRGRFLRAREAAREEVEALKDEQGRAALQVRTQQEVLLDSMLEGLLLLDERGCIQLANRAFVALFGVTVDIRGRTIMEALRLHELAALVSSLDTRKQVLGYELKLPGLNERWLQINAAGHPQWAGPTAWHGAGLS